MDPSAAQIEAQCVGQLSTLITTLLVLWRKILGHNGELERVNDVVTVHRKSVENDSKKRELSSAERKRLYVVLSSRILLFVSLIFIFIIVTSLPTILLYSKTIFF